LPREDLLRLWRAVPSKFLLKMEGYSGVVPLPPVINTTENLTQLMTMTSDRPTAPPFVKLPSPGEPEQEVPGEATTVQRGQPAKGFLNVVFFVPGLQYRHCSAAVEIRQAIQ
jgi:hypothetical protein